ncbi:hypothetical protein PSHI8_07940 [Polynucleobacter sp. SHI8]|uniref:hypothetical protein n=1 Tax=unclassified Polynucleobacter TaxID=2640945 RepID=UPI00248FD8B8|nr:MULTISPECIES: hypothetical protein [unclassified Polynucleobacter]BDW10712.1 hypothetical protein PSHI2_07940 [Polynucleobacter sp. SHI2]BDW13158.1 hypothetical protein PSHI8_07940 [Polynucleobacter sp. SHI8]
MLEIVSPHNLLQKLLGSQTLPKMLKSDGYPSNRRLQQNINITSEKMVNPLSFYDALTD